MGPVKARLKLRTIYGCITGDRIGMYILYLSIWIDSRLVCMDSS